MDRHARFILLASLAFGTVVFGGTVAVLAMSSPVDPWAAMAGILAAGALTVALLAMAWARRRTSGAGQRPNGADPVRDQDSGLAVVPLGDGQAAVIFDADAAGPVPAAAPDPAVAAREAAVAADTIWAAITDVVADAGRPPAPSGNLPGPGHGPLDWARRLTRRQPPPAGSDDSR